MAHSKSDVTFQTLGGRIYLKKEIPGYSISNLATCLPQAYREAFQDPGSPFIFYYAQPGEDGAYSQRITRGEFLDMSLKAAGVIARTGLKPGDRFLNGFGSNNPLDLAFRMGAAITRTTPVTLNWQADTGERAACKASLSGARLMLVDSLLPSGIIESVTACCPEIALYNTGNLDAEPLAEKTSGEERSDDKTEKIIIFTSGTTGEPKGVVLTWENYAVNTATFRQMFSPLREDPMHLLMVNPLHHANSTAMSDWFMREPDAVIHMLPRYATSYWTILCEVAENFSGMIIAPGVSRHFDFLEELSARDVLPESKTRLNAALSRVSFLLGSAPVGPITVGRARHWTCRIPLVRFGSTETCLQVLGTPTHLNEQTILKAFQAGWDRMPSPGYYIGRPHSPHTEVMVVRSAIPGDDGYMEPCAPDEEGYIIARGGNLMLGYLDEPQATREVLRDGWYLGFGDICFFLVNPHDGEADFYWLGRESALVIRGGANYSCEQIANELTKFVQRRYCIEEGMFDLAVVGLRLESEHEDTCCVMIDDSRLGAAVQEEIKATFIKEASGAVSKGSSPQRLCFGSIPRNFKGGVNIRELRKTWMEQE